MDFQRRISNNDLLQKKRAIFNFSIRAIWKLVSRYGYVKRKEWTGAFNLLRSLFILLIYLFWFSYEFQPSHVWRLGWCIKRYILHLENMSCYIKEYTGGVIEVSDFDKSLWGNEMIKKRIGWRNKWRSNIRRRGARIGGGKEPDDEKKRS